MTQTKGQLLGETTATGNITLNAQTDLRFADSDSSHYVALQAPATVASNVTYTLPAADGSANQILKTNGSGVLSWGEDPAGQWVTNGNNLEYSAGNVDINSDSNKLRLGASNDLELYHNGSNSRIVNTHASQFSIGSDITALTNAAVSEDLAKFIANGAVELYYDNSKKIQTASHGLDILDDVVFDNGTNAGKDINWIEASNTMRWQDAVKATFGFSDDLTIHHDGANSYITESGTGELYIQGNTFVSIRDSVDGDTMAKFIKDGAVELYHNASKKVNTTAAGVQMPSGTYFQFDAASSHAWAIGATTGSDLPAGSGIALQFHYWNNSAWDKISYQSADGIGVPDSKQFIAGDGSDLKIYHDGSNSFFDNLGTGSVVHRVQNGDIHFQYYDGSSAEDMAVLKKNGAVELYYDNAKQCETNSGGMNWADSKRAYFGNSSDLQIYHDGSNSFVSNTHASSFYIQSNGNLLLEHTNGENYVKGIADGGVELYYDNAKKFETTSSGVKVTGIIDAQEDVYLRDNKELHIGDDSDLQIFHDGSNSYLKNAGTGNIIFLSDDVQFKSDGGGNTGLTINTDGAVEAYYNNSKKFETNAGGVDVTGVMQCDGITLLDNEQFQCGTNVDLRIYHDSSNNGTYIKESGAGNLYIFSENLRIENADGSDSYIEANNGGAVELYWDGTKKFETTQYGAKVSTGLSAGYLEVSTTANLGDGHIEIIGGEAGAAVFSLTADEGDDNADKWRIQNAGDSLLGFRTKDSGSWVQKMKIGNDGHVTIDDGNLVLANGHGIDFSATGDGSGAATVSELLDDYEEGSFTPTLSSGTSDTPTTTGYGGYVKIGKKVYFQFYLIITGGTANANQLKFGGLPFTSSANTYSWGGAFLNYQIAMFDKGEDISFFIGASDNQLKAYTHSGDNLPGNSSLINDFTTHVSFVGHYVAA